MALSSWILFLVPVTVWSTTFYVITFQLNSPITPTYAVGLRFLFAALLLFAWLALRRNDGATRINGMNSRQHAITAASGVCAYGISYVLTYLSELVVPSGLVAIAFTLLIRQQ
jgi:drug/metabolite transporter (DMT)-like permease